ncbi:MAG: glycosyltransferase family 39 protein [Chloroflexia bacterium]
MTTSSVSSPIRTPHFALRTPHSALALAVLVGAVLRLIGLTRQGLWTDELYVVWEARQPLDLVLDPRIHVQHPPGYRLALHVWLGLGTAEGWVRLLPVVSGVLLIPVVWATARELWPERPYAAAASALAAATAPFLLHYSQDATAYSWAMLWTAASVLLLLRAWRTDRAAWWIAWAGSLLVAAYIHYFSFFPLGVEAVAVTVAGMTVRGRTQQLRHALLALVGAGLLYAPWVWVLMTTVPDSVATPTFPLTVNTQLLHWVPTLLVGPAHDRFWQSQVGLALVWGLLFGVGVWLAWRAARARELRADARAALLAAWVIAGTVGPYLFLRVTEPPSAWHSINFAAFAVPGVVLVLGGLFASLPERARVVVAACWLALVAVQQQGELTAPPKQDWRGLLARISSEARPGDAWLAFPALHAGAAAAYYPVPIPVLGGWFAADGSDPTGAAYWFHPGWRWRGFLDPQATLSSDWAGEIGSRTAGATRIWYLAGDGADGTYPPSPAAERALTAAGWHPIGEWHASPLVLRLYAAGAEGE